MHNTLEPLKIFLGEWELTGKQYAGPVGPEAPDKASEKYEVLRGGHFLVHHFEGKVGSNDASCLEIIGFDKARDCFTAHTYYNNGVTNQWELRGAKSDWQLSGSWDMEGRRAQVRCHIHFESDEKNSAHWEMSEDGEDWRSFWKIESRRVRHTANLS